VNKAARAELLRLRFRAVGGVAYKASGKPIRLREEYRPKGTCTGLTPHGQMTQRHQVEWVTRPDETPAKPLGEKKRQDESPLNRIAAKWRKFG
jgi:hypothetical protein